MKIVLNEQIITNNRNSIVKGQNYFQYVLKNLIPKISIQFPKFQNNKNEF